MFRCQRKPKSAQDCRGTIAKQRHGAAPHSPSVLFQPTSNKPPRAACVRSRRHIKRDGAITECLRCDSVQRKLRPELVPSSGDSASRTCTRRRACKHNGCIHSAMRGAPHDADPRTWTGKASVGAAWGHGIALPAGHCRDGGRDRAEGGGWQGGGRGEGANMAGQKRGRGGGGVCSTAVCQRLLYDFDDVASLPTQRGHITTFHRLFCERRLGPFFGS